MKCLGLSILLLSVFGVIHSKAIYICDNVHKKTNSVICLVPVPTKSANPEAAETAEVAEAAGAVILMPSHKSR